MKITSIRTIPLRRALAPPQRNSLDVRNERRFTFVIVETDAGIRGLGDAFGNAALMEPIVERRIAKAAVGLDPFDIRGLWRKLFESSPFWETGGSVVCAISAVEVACWDIQGKARGVPVSELLGGAKRNTVEAYASDLHWDDPRAMAETAQTYADAGYRWVKTHIGAAGEADADLARLEAVRRAIGPDIGLMIDINTAFDYETALAEGHRYLPFEPFWYEEPICPIDYEGHARLRRELPTPVATGENLYTLYGFAPLFACGGCDWAMPDILRCGGIRQARLICEEAERQGVTASPHNYSSGVGLAATLHLMAALPQTRLLEYDTTGTAIYEELFVEPLEVKDGFVRVPTAPGLGVELTDGIIAKYR
jgi:L-alanine-DL-glutamate epimerase-like enolase superfamily enzyme